MCNNRTGRRHVQGRPVEPVQVPRPSSTLPACDLNTLGFHGQHHTRVARLSIDEHVQAPHSPRSQRLLSRSIQFFPDHKEQGPAGFDQQPVRRPLISKVTLVISPGFHHFSGRLSTQIPTDAEATAPAPSTGETHAGLHPDDPSDPSPVLLFHDLSPLQGFSSSLLCKKILLISRPLRLSSHLPAGPGPDRGRGRQGVRREDPLPDFPFRKSGQNLNYSENLLL